MPSSSLAANVGGRPGLDLPVLPTGGLTDSHASTGEDFEQVLMEGAGIAVTMDGENVLEADLDPGDEVDDEVEALPQEVPDGFGGNTPPVVDNPLSTDSAGQGSAPSVLFPALSPTRSDIRMAQGTAGPIAEEAAIMPASAASSATVSADSTIHPDILSATTSGASTNPAPQSEMVAMPVLPPNIAAPPAPAVPIRLPESVSPPSRQVADLLLRMDADRAEITLFPEELGTVRIALSREGDRLVVRLWAERAETLDLLRRHSDDLAQDLALAGHEDALVDLGSSGGRSDLDPSAQGGRDPVEEGQRGEVFSHEGTRRQQVMLPGRVDLRL